MNTDARRKASAAFVAKRKALGWRKVTLWLSPEALAKLDAMKASAGSKDKAAEAAILAWGGNVPDRSIRLPDATWAKLARRAVETGQSVNALVAAGAELAVTVIHRTDVEFADTYAPKRTWPKAIKFAGGVDPVLPPPDPSTVKALHVEVPVLKRPAFNPQLKKPRGK